MHIHTHWQIHAYFSNVHDALNNHIHAVGILNIRTYIHTYIQTFKHTFIHTWIHMCWTHMHAHIFVSRTYIHTYTKLYVFIHTHTNTYMRTHIRAHKHTNLNPRSIQPESENHMDVCMIKHPHIYIHINEHTHTHTKTQSEVPDHTTRICRTKKRRYLHIRAYCMQLYAVVNEQTVNELHTRSVSS